MLSCKLQARAQARRESHLVDLIVREKTRGQGLEP